MTGIIGTIVLLGLASVSSRCYADRGRGYALDKNRQTQGTRSFKYVYRYIQATTLAAGIGSYLSDHSMFFEIHHNFILTIVGMACACLAMLGFVSAKKTLGASYSPCFDPYLPKTLVSRGLYRYIRHPIYSLNILSVSSIFVSTGSLWIGFNAVILTVYYGKSARVEEQVLRAVFPEYETYVQNTKRFIPLVY